VNRRAVRAVLHHGLQFDHQRSFKMRRSGVHAETEKDLPVKLGVRAMESIAHPQPEAPKVAPEWVNNLLFQMSRVEQKTVSTLPMPFGSSLMVVGHRGRAA
jgi:hypothetical protein